MKKLLISLISASLTVSYSVPIALADANAPNAQSPGKTSHSLLKAPKAIAGFCAAVVVGTPICFVRKLPREIKDGGHGLAGSIVGESNNKFVLVASTVAWSPFACVAAAFDGPAWAVRNAWEEKPFSKEQFSMDWLEPEVTPPSQ